MIKKLLYWTFWKWLEIMTPWFTSQFSLYNKLCDGLCQFSVQRSLSCIKFSKEHKRLFRPSFEIKDDMPTTRYNYKNSISGWSGKLDRREDEPLPDIAGSSRIKCRPWSSYFWVDGYCSWDWIMWFDLIINHNISLDLHLQSSGYWKLWQLS